jgi:hypothetical protein
MWAQLRSAVRIADQQDSRKQSRLRQEAVLTHRIECFIASGRAFYRIGSSEYWVMQLMCVIGRVIARVRAVSLQRQERVLPRSTGKQHR